MAATGTRELRNRTALVTGGSGGIGRALAAQLAGAGAAVAIGYAGGADRAEEAAGRITEMLPASEGDEAPTPVKRFGTPEEVAGLALAMLVNGYVTGKTFLADGGMYPR